VKFVLLCGDNMIPILYIESILRNKNGLILQREKKKANSLVEQMVELFYVQMSGVSFNIRRENAITVLTPQESTVFSITDLSGSGVNQGILLGSSLDPVVINDYKLHSLILDGISAGRLQRGTMKFTAPATAPASGTSSFTFRRTFTNASGNTVFVGECGIYCFKSASVQRFMIDRTLLIPTNVPNLCSFTIIYTVFATI
jgi:hypothetical protein